MQLKSIQTFLVNAERNKEEQTEIIGSVYTIRQGKLKEIESLYRERLPRLESIAPNLKLDLQKHLAGQKRIDQIVVRPKRLDRFVEKAMKLDKHGNYKYTDPLHQIQDQIGAKDCSVLPR